MSLLDTSLWLERVLLASYRTGAPQQLLMELEWWRQDVLDKLLEEQLAGFDRS